MPALNGRRWSVIARITLGLCAWTVKLPGLHLPGTRKGGQRSPLLSVGSVERPYQLGQAGAVEWLVVDGVPGGLGSVGGGGSSFGGGGSSVGTTGGGGNGHSAS